MDDSLWVPLSALQHYRFCPRQCALIHTEAVWEENRLTAEGRALHERVHSTGRERRDTAIITRGMRLYSHRHGLSGIADVVEFHPVTDDQPGTNLPGEKGRWIPFPVEYKRGRPKKNGLDEEQLAGQAICLSEMFSVLIRQGALFYGQTRRRKVVEFTDDLLQKVSDLIKDVRLLLTGGETPKPVLGKQCDKCSLIDSCLPHIISKPVQRYFRNVFEV